MRWSILLVLTCAAGTLVAPVFRTVSSSYAGRQRGIYRACGL